MSWRKTTQANTTLITRGSGGNAIFAIALLIAIAIVAAIGAPFVVASIVMPLFYVVALVIASPFIALFAFRTIIVTIPTFAGVVEVEAPPTIVSVPSTISITIAHLAALNVI
jgi:hypothetical protein